MAHRLSSARAWFQDVTSGRWARSLRGLAALVAVAAVAGGCGDSARSPVARIPRAAPLRPAPRPTRPPSLHSRRQVARDRRAVEDVLRHTSYVLQGRRRRRDVALTFDDGPGPATARIVAILRRMHVPATFFVVGAAARAHPGLIRRELRAGAVIGDHTETHPFLAGMPRRAQRSQILRGARALHAAGAPFPRLFRPPFGSFNRTTLRLLRRARMLMVLWSVDTQDYRRPGTRRIAYTALSGARPGAIILMHDGGGPRWQTAAALPRIIRRLRRRHFHLVTVPKLIHDDPPPRHQRPPRPLSG